MDRIERIESPQPHERTWEVTPVVKRDPERRRQEERKRRQEEQRRREASRDDGEPPHLIDVQA